MLQRASDLRRTLAAAAILTVAVLAAGCSKPPAEQYKDYMASGQEFVDESDRAAAAIQFRNAARVMPNEAEPHYQLALVEVQQKKLQDAYRSASQAARIRPGHEDQVGPLDVVREWRPYPRNEEPIGGKEEANCEGARGWLLSSPPRTHEAG